MGAPAGGGNARPRSSAGEALSAVASADPRVAMGLESARGGRTCCTPGSASSTSNACGARRQCLALGAAGAPLAGPVQIKPGQAPGFSRGCGGCAKPPGGGDAHSWASAVLAAAAIAARAVAHNNTCKGLKKRFMVGVSFSTQKGLQTLADTAHAKQWGENCASFFLVMPPCPAPHPD
jgi:hypothetical protein